jgi:hypothetical protein
MASIFPNGRGPELKVEVMACRWPGDVRPKLVAIPLFEYTQVL